MEPAEAFGLVLRRKRLESGMTQERLALDAGLERVFISWLESGKRQPTFTTMVKLARALACTVTELVHEAEEQLLNSAEE